MNLSIVLDILILAIIAFFIVLSSKQGFVKTFIGFVGCFAALILSIVLSWTVSDLVYGNFIRPGLVSSVEDNLDSKAFASVPRKGAIVMTSIIARNNEKILFTFKKASFVLIKRQIYTYIL